MTEPIKQTPSMLVNRVALRDLITASFTLQDLEILCSDLGIKSDEIQGDTRTAKAIHIVEYFEQRNRIPELLSACWKSRPQQGWPEVLGIELPPSTLPGMYLKIPEAISTQVIGIEPSVHGLAKTSVEPESTQTESPARSRRWLENRLSKVAIVATVATFVAGAFLWQLITTLTKPTPPTASLISASVVLDWGNGFVVDLRHASKSGNGIPVYEGQALRLSELWVSLPEDKRGYSVLAEVYATDATSDTLIGITDEQPFTFGMKQLSSARILAAAHEEVKTAWKASTQWRAIKISVITKDEKAKEVGRQITTINLGGNDTARMIDRPYASIISVQYRVNGGDPVMLDVPSGSKGLGIKADDRLEVLQVWYHANEDGDPGTTVSVACFLNPTPGSQITGTNGGSTSEQTFERGIHVIQPAQPFVWVVPSNADGLAMQLVRGGNISPKITDVLVLPFQEPAKD